MKTFLQDSLTEIQDKGLRRSLRTVDGPQGKEITIDGRKVLNFCSNNYLGLADDERLRQAAIDSIKENGFGSGASRLVCGNLSAHEALEKKIAQFKGAAKALVFSTGYMANVGIISSVCGREDIILADKLNHASIIDGIILSQAEFRRYAHNDMDSLEALLRLSKNYKKRLIVTDSVFSMDGDIASLDKIVELAYRYDASVMVDEAHALGVMGEKGRGLVEHFGLENKIDIQMGTLSKAAGSFGAYVCGKEELIDFLINKARSFIYTTAMPPSIAAASLRAIEIIEDEPQLRKELWRHTHYVRENLKRMGFDTLNSVTPIIPIFVKDSSLALKFSQMLFDQGIWISAIRPQTVPVNTARLRLTLMATHTQKDCDSLLENLREIGKDLCLI